MLSCTKWVGNTMLTMAQCTSSKKVGEASQLLTVEKDLSCDPWFRGQLPPYLA
jgi:hypothetical protein